MIIADIIAKALNAPHGLGVALPDDQAARRFRRAFYTLRERRRRQGDTSWDGLAIVLPLDKPGAVHLIKKSDVHSVPAVRDHAVAHAWPLSPLQLPRHLTSRGRNPLRELADELLAGRRRSM